MVTAQAALDYGIAGQVLGQRRLDDRGVPGRLKPGVPAAWAERPVLHGPNRVL